VVSKKRLLAKQFLVTLSVRTTRRSVSLIPQSQSNHVHSRDSFGGIFIKLNGDHKSLSTNVANMVVLVLLQMLQASNELGTSLLNVVLDVFILKYEKR
jgi:hypothetical protein